MNVNAVIGIIATLEGIVWTKISSSDRAKARTFLSRLRTELDFPVPKTRRAAR
jgi:hypothetical protein